MRYIALEFEKFIQSESKETLRISRYLVEPMLNALSLVCAVWMNSLPSYLKIHLFQPTLYRCICVYSPAGIFWGGFLFVFTFPLIRYSLSICDHFKFICIFYCFFIFCIYIWVSSVVLRWTGDRPQHI